MVDYIDGEVARARGGNSKLGQYLDTSLDWLWLQLLIFSISYSHNICWAGTLSIIFIMWGNWIEFNGKVKLKLPFPFGISHLLVIGVFYDIGIYLILLTQFYRVGRMYKWSISKG
jgi:phosphatidylglycerophosphate synthase